MQPTTRVENGILIVPLSGTLDTEGAAIVEALVENGLSAHVRHVVFDCTNLEMVTSSGLRLFLLAAKKSRTVGGRVLMAAVNRHVLQVFEITRLATLFSFTPDLGDAIRALSS